MAGLSYGRHAEEAAARHLVREGYRVVARNVRTRRGEIDIVAYDGDALVFIEVKARRRTLFGEAAWAVDRRKQQRMIRAASAFLATSFRSPEALPPCRFDVVAIHGVPPRAEVRLIRNAFEGIP